MKKDNKKISAMVRTPSLNIPLGEVIVLENGNYALHVKRSNKNEYDTITLAELIDDIIKKGSKLKLSSVSR